MVYESYSPINQFLKLLSVMSLPREIFQIDGTWITRDRWEKVASPCRTYSYWDHVRSSVFKGPTWASIIVELNQRIGKDFNFKQVQQKHNRLRLKQRKWSQLLKHMGLGWDEQTQIVTCSDEVWQNVIEVCLLLFINYILIAIMYLCNLPPSW